MSSLIFFLKIKIKPGECCFSFQIYSSITVHVDIYIRKVIANHAEKLHLIFVFKGEQLVEQLVGRRCTNETVNVNVDKRGHNYLTVKSVHEATVSWDGVTEVFYFEGSLESAGKKATEWSDRRCEYRQCQCMYLKRMHGNL